MRLCHKKPFRFHLNFLECSTLGHSFSEFSCYTLGTPPTRRGHIQVDTLVDSLSWVLSQKPALTVNPECAILYVQPIHTFICLRLQSKPDCSNIETWCVKSWLSPVKSQDPTKKFHILNCLGNIVCICLKKMYTYSYRNFPIFSQYW